MKKNKDLDYEVSSGNVFEDLGLPDPEIRLAKAELARQINKLIDEKNLTQSEAAELLGIDQPKISHLSKGRLAGFSIERLFRFLNILGQEITININRIAAKDPHEEKRTTSQITVQEISDPKRN